MTSIFIHLGNPLTYESIDMVCWFKEWGIWGFQYRDIESSILCLYLSLFPKYILQLFKIYSYSNSIYICCRM